MKLHFVVSVIFLWCVFLCTSCDKQSVIGPAIEEGGSVVLTIKPKGFIHDTIIEYNHSGGSILDSINNSLNWTEKDSLYVKTISGKELKFVYQDDGQKHNSFICAERDVQELDDIQFVRYPLLDTLSDNKVSISIEGQVQSSTSPLAHLRKYNHRVWSAPADSKHQNSDVFELNELTCILHISVALPVEVKEAQNLVLKTTGTFVIDEKYDYVEGIVIPGKRSSALSVKLDNIQSTGEVLDLYLVLLPSQLKGESINVRLYSKDGLCFTSDVEGIDFREGRLYEVETTCRIDESYTGLAQVYIDTPDDADSIERN